MDCGTSSRRAGISRRPAAAGLWRTGCDPSRVLIALARRVVLQPPELLKESFPIAGKRSTMTETGYLEVQFC